MRETHWQAVRSKWGTLLVRPGRHAFTLIEVLVVVVLMAILAAVAMAPAAAWIEESIESAAASNVHSLRSAIDRYEVDHGGTLPRITFLALPQLTSSTNANGAIGSGPQFPFGPYIVGEIPENPFNTSRLVIGTLESPPASLENRFGWVYNPTTGEVWAGRKRTRGICP